MQKIIKISMGWFSCLWLIKFFSILPYNRMAADDFTVGIFLKEGVWNVISATYSGGNGRFSASLVQAIAVFITGESGKIFVYSAITVTALVISFIVFFKSTFRANLKTNFIYLVAVVTAAGLYLITPNKSESWYWLTGSATYLWPTILFLPAVSIFFSGKNTKRASVIAFVLVFMATAFNETFGVISVAIFFGANFMAPSDKKYLSRIMLLASVISFLIMYFSPGNTLREQGPGSNPMSFVGSILYSVQEGPLKLISMVKSNFMYLASLLGILVFIFSENLPLSKNIKKDLSILLLIVLTPVILSIIYMIPAFKILGRVQPDRSDITLSFIILLTVIALSFELSQILNLARFHSRLLYKLGFYFVALMVVFVSFDFTRQLASDFYVVKNYAGYYDSMIKSLKDASFRKDASQIEVSLPPSGLVAATLTGPGKYDYKNLALSEFYGTGRIIFK